MPDLNYVELKLGLSRLGMRLMFSCSMQKLMHICRCEIDTQVMHWIAGVAEEGMGGRGCFSPPKFNNQSVHDILAVYKYMYSINMYNVPGILPGYICLSWCKVIHILRV